MLDEYVQFKDSKATSTTVTIQKQQSAILAGDLLIRPIAVKTCTIQTAFPTYEDAGVACDNSIRLTFSQKLSAANDLSKISITIEGIPKPGQNTSLPQPFSKASRTSSPLMLI